MAESFTFRPTPFQAQQLELWADKSNLHESEIVRMALDMFFQDAETKLAPYIETADRQRAHEAKILKKHPELEKKYGRRKD